jgi:murein DD-endopeptidase MepM/ murein hydrolase activator NlpD
MKTTMKRVFYFFTALLLTACNLPASESIEITSEPAPTSFVLTATQTEFLSPTATETLIPPTSTATPIPCDPLTVDFCIVDGMFIFQRPIQPPYNMVTDLTYAYASTQNGKRDPHHGVEFQNDFGTPVHAAGDGEVVFADVDKIVKFSPWTNFYGNVVLIRHANEVYTLYAHLSTIAVQAGAQVKAGEVIGQVGQTGGATGSHLHFEVRTGSDYFDHFSTQNPELWMMPPPGTGAISITLQTGLDKNYERPLVISRYVDTTDELLYTYYITSYTKTFEMNNEDAVISNLVPGRYKIAFGDPSGLKERFVFVEEGKLTEVVFVLVN